MKMKSLIFAMMILVSSGAMAFSVSGDSFDANFKITSVNPGNGGTVITGEGIAGGGFGKVYYSHHLQTANGVSNEGHFDGHARTINQDGVMVAATLQGTWVREGTKIYIHSLDSFKDGINFAKGTYDLMAGTFTVEVWPVK
jgi:hypothetical protein